jgi:4-hydroxybenzoate polyprenyltransferase
MNVWLKQLRIHHYIKNILIFLPIIGIQRFEIHEIINLTYLFLLFSLYVSMTYIINDIVDFKKDRLHPQKKYRPIALGLIDKRKALGISLFILILILFSTWFFFSKIIFFLFVFYLILTVAYSLFIKKIKIFDILILTCFYIFRIYLGATESEIEISIWLSSFCFFIFLAIACIKRISEIQIEQKNKKVLGRNYKKEDINFLTTISVSSTLLTSVVLINYSQTENYELLYNNLIVLYVLGLFSLTWLLNAIYVAINGKMNHDPVLFALKNKLTYIFGLSLIILYLIRVYQ